MYKKIEKIMYQNPITGASWSKLYFAFNDYIPTFIVIGKNYQKIIQKIHQKYCGEKIIVGTNDKKNTLPLFFSKPFSSSQTLIYTCLGKKCFEPTNNYNTILNKLKNK